MHAQDERSVSDNLKVTGLRFGRALLRGIRYANAEADGRTFRDETGAPYIDRAALDPNILWSPRAGFNWNVDAERRTRVRGGTGIFTGRPAYVWISNRSATPACWTGFEQLTTPRRGRSTRIRDTYKPTNVTGDPSATYELALTNPDFSSRSSGGATSPSTGACRAASMARPSSSTTRTTASTTST
ncbi:MAG: hypothetical protein R2712_23315 [Vicinamibacterales bacterium]